MLDLYRRQRPEVADALDYSHPTLVEQLDLGLRKLELDVFLDPEGGRYASPGGIDWVASAGLPPGPPFDVEREMSVPGLKVLHVQDLDYRSSCLTMKRCLLELRSWSEAHPSHLPIVITVNAKDAPIERAGPGGGAFVEPLPFDSGALDVLDREILSVLGRDRLVTPDDVRGDRDSLEEAVLVEGWPPLDECRGRFLFVLDERGEKLEAYVEGHPSLRDRVLFVNAEPGRPEAAFLILNDPVGRAEEIRRRVEEGYLVRTRADADTREARAGDTTRRDAAIASGAHFVSTDYYRPDDRFGTGYRVEMPQGGFVRCNPRTARAGCRLDDYPGSP